MNDESSKQSEAAAQLNSDVSRRQALTTLGKLGIGGAAAAAALSAGNLPAALAGRSNTLAQHNYKFVFVNHVTTNAFFTPTQYGAADAAALLGSSYQWTGSQTSNVSEMVRAFQTAVAGGADGIAVALVDLKAFNAPIANALKKGIPVVGYNADVPSSGRLSYIGQDLMASGQSVGQKLASTIPAGGHVAIFVATPGSLNLQPRVDGVIAALKAAGKSLTYEVVATGALLNQEQTAVESYYLGHKTVKGLVAVDGGSTVSVALTSKKYGLQKKGVSTGGYDTEATTTAAVASGDMGFTIDQQPYLQGFLPVFQLFLYKASGGLTFPSDTNTSLKFLTKSNIAPFLAPSRFEGTKA